MRKENEVSWKPEVIEIAPAPVSKELKKRWSYFIRKVYETDPLICPKCQDEMWFDKLLTTLRGPEWRIISFIDQPEVIKKSFLSACEHAQAGNTWIAGRSLMPPR